MRHGNHIKVLADVIFGSYQFFSTFLFFPSGSVLYNCFFFSVFWCFLFLKHLLLYIPYLPFFVMCFLFLFLILSPHLLLFELWIAYPISLRVSVVVSSCSSVLLKRSRCLLRNDWTFPSISFLWASPFRRKGHDWNLKWNLPKLKQRKNNRYFFFLHLTFTKHYLT